MQTRSTTGQLASVDNAGSPLERLAQFRVRYPAPPNLPAPVIKEPALPLISVVTPSYNQGQFIRQTIESVLSQDYPNLEYWVIDGRSSDGTLHILEQYVHDPRYHWISEPDVGQSDALNKGLVRAQGALFGWLNSDDILLPNALQRIAAAWRATNKPAILYGLGRHIDELGQDLGYCPAQSRTMTLDRVLWVGKNALIQPAAFCPTEAVREVGGLDLARHYALDLDLWVKLAETLPFCFVPHAIAQYRLHATSKTVAAPALFIEDVRQVLEGAVSRGTISPKRARSRAELFAARTYLMPGMVNWPAAAHAIRTALKIDPAVLSEAVFIVMKAAVRLGVGSRLWAWARLAKARYG